MNCNGCGVDLDPTQEEVDLSVEGVLDASLKDAEKHGGVCPFCGHSKETPYLNRKPILFALLSVILLIVIGVGIGINRSRHTERALAIEAAMTRIANNPDLQQLLGSPISAGSDIQGEIKQDETGWKEVDLIIPLQAPKGHATAHAIGGRDAGPWSFTTFEVDFQQQRKRVDLISGSVIEYNPNAYVDIHTRPAIIPEEIHGVTVAAHLSGDYPCVYRAAGTVAVSQLGKCSIPTMHSGSVDCFETDLRYGRFVMRQTDLMLDDVFKVPLTRSYNSMDWVGANPVHAYGKNTNHPYDIAPLGTRNPYSYQILALEDGDFLYFDRVSKGSGYADAVFQHTETSTKFYKAVHSWNGSGWTTRLADGSEIQFPESYGAKNLAQGAAIEFRDPQQNRLKLIRDAQRNLIKIETPHNRWIQFKYDDFSRIVQAEDDKGNWAKYTYESEGMLSQVVSSSGTSRNYVYDGALMTQVSDEKGHILVINQYNAQKMLSRQRFEDGSTYGYTYQWVGNHNYPESVIVTFPDGKMVNVKVADDIPQFVKRAAQ